jgi:enoyl-CoA hydratase
MTTRQIEIERIGRVAIVRFDREDSLNALSLGLMSELIETARSFEGDSEIVSVVFAGSSKVFCAGIDLKDPALFEALNAPLGKRRDLLAYGPKMCRALEEMDQVTIAAIEGYCVGGGVSLAVSCDFRIVAAGSYFRLPELALGMNMSWQTLPRLVSLIGPARTKRMVMLGEKVTAEQSLCWGLSDEVVQDGETLSSAVVLANKISAMPPIPIKMTKQAVNAASSALHNAVSYMDGDQFTLCQMTEDHREALAALLEKRAPIFKGQ